MRPKCCFHIMIACLVSLYIWRDVISCSLRIWRDTRRLIYSFRLWIWRDVTRTDHERGRDINEQQIFCMTSAGSQPTTQNQRSIFTNIHYRTPNILQWISERSVAYVLNDNLLVFVHFLQFSFYIQLNYPWYSVPTTIQRKISQRHRNIITVIVLIYKIIFMFLLKCEGT